MAQALSDLIASICGIHSQTTQNAITNTARERVNTRRSAQDQHKRIVDWASKSLRAPQNQRVRVNQFEIDERYQGLVEKFFVLNREDLSIALEDRIDKLGSRRLEGFVPELLALFLELEDKPLVESDVNDLVDHKSAKDGEPEPLTWEGILRDDPFSDDDLWQDAGDLAYSDDEESIDSSAPVTPAKSQVKVKTKKEDQKEDVSPKDLLVAVDDNALTEVEASVDLFRAPIKNGLRKVSEAFIVREILSTLRGLPAILFILHEPPTISVSPQVHACRTATLASPSLNEILTRYAAFATVLYRLRLWTKQPQQHAVIQRFQASVCQALHSIDRTLSDYEAEVVNANSVNGVLRLESCTSPIQELAWLLEAICKRLWNHDNDVTLVNDLYDQLCALDSSGMTQEYSILRAIFEETLQAYLRPLAHWMTEGVLLAQNHNLLILLDEGVQTEGNEYMVPSRLRTALDGQVIAPCFISVQMAERILAAGQNVRILKATGLSTARSLPDAEPDMIDRLGETAGSPPFTQEIQQTLNTWIAQRSLSSAKLLTEHLWSVCRLARFLDALECIFFSRDGSIFHNVSEAIFARIDRQHRNRNSRDWNDVFALSEIFRENLSSNTAVDVTRLTIRRIRPPSHASKKGTSHMTSFSGFIIEFKLPWLISLITPDLKIHQQIFTFLLQINRAKTLLEYDKPSLRSKQSSDRCAYRTWQCLLWFVNILNAHVLSDVLSRNIQTLRHDMLGAEGLNPTIEIYARFSARSEEDCLLTKRFAPVRQGVLELLELAWHYRTLRNKADMALSIRGKHVTVRSEKMGRRAQLRDKLTSDLQDTDIDSDDSSDDARSQVESDYNADSEQGQQEDLRPARDAISNPRKDEYQTMEAINRQFARLLKFVVAGLRSITGSSDPEDTLSPHTMLADKLQWGIDAS